MHDEGGGSGRFEAALREWAARPVRTPAAAAAAGVRARLGSQQARGLFPALGLKVAASLAAALVVGLGLRVLWPPPPVGVPHTAAVVAPPLPANVMVFWLDQDTPVYFVTDFERSQETTP